MLDLVLLPQWGIKEIDYALHCFSETVKHLNFQIHMAIKIPRVREKILEVRHLLVLPVV